MFYLTRQEQLIALILIGGIIVGGIVIWLRRDPAPPVPEPLDYEINLSEIDREEISPALIDVNTAREEELMEVPGIGPKTAETIVKYRETIGPFEHIDELTKVPGIGEKKLQGFKEHLEVKEGDEETVNSE
jgi:competence protein ComEA